MKKSLSKIFLTLVFLSAVFAGGKKDYADSLSLGVLTGPSGIPCAHFLETTPTLNGAEVSYQTFASANQLLPKLINGEVDIGFLPPNVAAKLYSTNRQCIKVIGVSGNGMLSLITKDQSIKSIKDLQGKTITVAGSGATPEYLTRYILMQNGVEATLDFSIPNSDIAAALISGKISYAVVPEPFTTVATMQDSSVKVALNMQEEFYKVSGIENFPMTVIVARTEFIEQNPSLVKAFLSSYKNSLNWTLKNPTLAGKEAESINLGLKAAVVEKAIPSCAFVYATPKEGRKNIEALLSIFLKFAPESIGSSLPDDGFYYQ